MDIFKNRLQQRLYAKAVVTVLVLIVLIWILLSLRTTQDEVNTCDPTITVRKMGQFGNQIWEYISLYVVSQANQALLRKYSLFPYIEQEMKENLEQLFENLTIQPFPMIYLQCDDRETVVIAKGEPFQLPDDMHRRNVLLDSYSARYEDLIKFGVDNMKRELRFRQNYVDGAMRKLEEIRGGRGQLRNETTFVGMHYRGGDYIPHLKGNHGREFKGPPNYSFYTAAMDYFKRKYHNPIFILISIDSEWLSKNAEKIRMRGNVLINPFENDRNGDLALLSHCNHSVINYGTFGVTAALFAGGDTIFYDLGLPVDHRGETIALGMSKLLPHWIGMKNTVEDDNWFDWL